ncbi:hypothetical protein BN7_3520 [Wickerhamomyces ciferrii]|uniref:Protein AHC1 n=1 Tax=Wickerhamomyces ciferrii (strain ATCC 14091 / BCRC 22168 / CBS 111 / JCM 3599 / NBRC 0793 / NRRL Y-1031 F-60-10) TaxID=1206466 RepID=K0KFP4_WICCF|nr:uncharacterized protein BN7_3520 [Wickerhamomyces ciferrii]CCH43965.1 hypothetical protein BN7_3520 [Wickerhamomyces ciferrii]
MSQGEQHFIVDDNDDQNKHNIHLQIATPKSPNSDGFSPTEIRDDHQIDSLGHELKTNLSNQIDIEILLKHREYNLVNNEISKIQTQLDTMKKLHSDPSYVKYIENLIDLKKNTQKQYQSSINPYDQSEMITRRQSNYGIRKNYGDEYDNKPNIPHRTSYGGLRPVLDSNGNKICVHKRSDGVIVKVECPNCARCDFGSAQGFLNHARLSHQVEYKSQDHAALVCGSVLPDDEQDEIGLQSVKKLKELGLDPDNNLNPEILNNLNSDDLNAPQKKKLKRSLSISKPSLNSGYLEKLYNNNKNGNEGDQNFKDLYKDVTTRTELEFDIIDDDISTPPISQDSTIESSFKKGHNRRKSRGGLSAVKFEDQLISSNSIEYSHSRSPSKDEGISEYILEDSITSSNSVRFSEQNYTFGSDPIFGGGGLNGNDLTPAQRRRVPTIPNPLRTRSRSSRENSN